MSNLRRSLPVHESHGYDIDPYRARLIPRHFLNGLRKGDELGPFSGSDIGGRVDSLRISLRVFACFHLDNHDRARPAFDTQQVDLAVRQTDIPLKRPDASAFQVSLRDSFALSPDGWFTSRMRSMPESHRGEVGAYRSSAISNNRINTSSRDDTRARSCKRERY